MSHITRVSRCTFSRLP